MSPAIPGIGMDSLVSVCTFHKQGRCTRGSKCKFVHEDYHPAESIGCPLTNAVVANENNTASQSPLGYQPPMMIQIPQETPIFCIDVECGATSRDHNGRTPISIGMADGFGRPLCKLFVQDSADKPVVSYLTPITGVTAEDIRQQGKPFDDCLSVLRSFLTPEAVIIGQNISKDMHWLGLKEGTDFASLIDLSAVFRVWNRKRNSWTIFSQDHIAKVWLNVIDRPSHDALDDALLSMGLFNAYRQVQWDQQRLHYMQMMTLSAPMTPSFASRQGSIEGCCLGHKKSCTCGGTFFIS